ncbi:MAG: 2OG-Fe(II) oxygenase [Bdellovibrio bacteriovorus]
MTSPPELWQSAPIRRYRVPDAERLNREILAAFRGLEPEDFDRRSHLIDGRYENLYLDRARIPVLGGLLDHALSCAGLILGRSPSSLRCGFWFNAMGPGQSTSEHTHDENDELLSAVYYVEAPEGSGDLVLYDGPLTIRLAPEAGALVLFPPDLPHAVEHNRSGQSRLSIGINFGPLPPP